MPVGLRERTNALRKHVSFVMVYTASRDYTCFNIGNWPFSYDRLAFSIRDSQEMKREVHGPFFATRNSGGTTM